MMMEIKRVEHGNQTKLLCNFFSSLRWLCFKQSTFGTSTEFILRPNSGWLGHRLQNYVRNIGGRSYMWRLERPYLIKRVRLQRYQFFLQFIQTCSNTFFASTHFVLRKFHVDKLITTKKLREIRGIFFLYIQDWICTGSWNGFAAFILVHYWR